MNLPRSIVLLALSAATSASAASFISLPAVNGNVYGFAASGSTLYIAGGFTSVGGSARNGLAAINLTDMSVTSWNPDLGLFGGAGSARSVAVSPDGSQVYFGGNFDTVGGQARTFLASASSSGAVGSFAPSVNSIVNKVLVSSSSVYAIGNFTSANSTARVGFAGFDTGGTLNGFDPGLASYNTGGSFRGAALNADGSRLHVALGNSSVDFTDTNGDPVNRRGFVSLQTSDGRESGFRPVLNEGPFSSGTFAVATDGSKLHIAGPFNNAEGTGVDHIATFNNEVFDPAASPGTGAGPDGAVRSVSPFGGVLYVAGAFNNAGGSARTGLAAIDSTTGAVIAGWDALSNTAFGNTDTTVFAYDGKVFIAGQDLVGDGHTLLGEAVEFYGAVTGVTAVPEPESFAWVFGGLALGAAWFHRRSKAA